MRASVVSFLAIALAGCGSTPKEGEGCSQANEATCTSSKNQLVCKDGIWTAYRCDLGCSESDGKVLCEVSVSSGGDCNPAMDGKGSCSGRTMTVCRDGVFTDETCPGICQLAGDKPFCAPCSTHSECPEAEICAAGACVPGVGRSYNVTLASVSVPTIDSAGEAWDLAGGAPDLLACLTLDGGQSVVDCTPVVDDSFTASWNHTFNLTLTANTEPLLVVLDEDVSENDLVEALSLGTGTTFLGLVKAGGFTGLAVGGAVTWEVQLSAK